MPIGQVEQPRARASCLSFFETPPARAREQHANENVLSQNAPDERYDHRQDLIQGPQPDQLGIIQMRRYDVLVRGHRATLPSARTRLLPRLRRWLLQIVAVTVEVTIGTPVPAPTPTPTGIAI